MDTGIRFILFLQSLGGKWLTTPMQIFSLLGNEEFYLLVMPLFYLIGVKTEESHLHYLLPARTIKGWEVTDS